MLQGDRFAIVGGASLFKGEVNSLSDRRLIVFGDEYIMSRTLFDQIVGQLALSQQCVGGNGFTINIERTEGWDKHSDLIGLFGLVAIFYRQGTDFFWVWQVSV